MIVVVPIILPPPLLPLKLRDGVEAPRLNDKLTQMRSVQPNGREDEELLCETTPVGRFGGRVVDVVRPRDKLTHKRSVQPKGRADEELVTTPTPVGVVAED